MILVILNREDFEYDLHSLIKAFYPDEDVVISGQQKGSESADALLEIEVVYQEQDIEIILRDAEKTDMKKVDISGQERPQVKSTLKTAVYRLLSDYTGKRLPWGTLSGIRPVKIIMQQINEGRSNVEIARHMRETYLVSPQKAALGITIANREREILKPVPKGEGYSLYLGIPFCPSICQYCSFSSYPLERWEQRVDEYVDALCREIAWFGPRLQHKKLSSIYVGGGTPTTLRAEQLARLMACIDQYFPRQTACEYTVEAGRPDSITREKLEVIRQYGADRISINPQTMNEDTLERIGRRHTVAEIREAYQTAREVGFTNINMDLIVGLPGEGQKEVEATLEQIREMDPDSMTIHSLAIKRASRLAMDKVQQQMQFQNSEAIMDLTAEYARKMEMNPYYLYRQKNIAGNFENVGYAKVDKAGIYNILIMEEIQTIVALGAGAVTKIVMPDTGRIERVVNVKDVTHYLDRIDEMIERKQEFFEKYRYFDTRVKRS